jgi:hypothetical protein
MPQNEINHSLYAAQDVMISRTSCHSFVECQYSKPHSRAEASQEGQNPLWGRAGDGG